MKKYFAISLALILALCLATPALAVTPDLDIPDMPAIPDISDDIDFGGIDFGGIIGDWFGANPVPPLVPTEPAEPTEPVEDTDAPIGGCWFDWIDWILDWLWWMG